MSNDGREDGVDIVKFFLGVMSLLTVFVALIAAYNWSKVKTYAEEVDSDEVDLGTIQRVAGDKQFLELVARNQFFKGIEDVTSKDFGRHLTDAAEAMKLELKGFKQVGQGSAGAALRQTFDRQSYEFTLDQQPLEVIVSYLWYLQGSWPGLKIENLTITEARSKQGWAGWTAQVTASIFRPKEQAR
jgi:hypothetical protein